ncbi:hypothetical protein UlMin_042347 [Ulmus minor]
MHITIRKKAWKPAFVCADTFQAGAFDQLKQNTIKAKIPFYDTFYMESDLVKIAVEGVETFKKEKCDLIIVDTSGRHKQEAALFEEIISPSLYSVILSIIINILFCLILQKPYIVIFVMDSSIGQVAFDQAQVFKQSVSIGVVIVFEFFIVTCGLG